MSGRLIAIEGIDGAGKTTQARKLVKWLRSKGLKARYTIEPTRGSIGRVLREMALKRDVDPRVEALLFAADRLEHLRRIIEPLMLRGFIVVSDRYVHSSLAYQSVTTGDGRWVSELNKFARRPDLAILLDLEPRLGLGRIRRRKRARFEEEDLLKRVRDRYLELARDGELEVIDASQDPDKVFEDIKTLVEERVLSLGRQ